MQKLNENRYETRNPKPETLNLKRATAAVASAAAVAAPHENLIILKPQKSWNHKTLKQNLKIHKTLKP